MLRAVAASFFCLGLSGGCAPVQAQDPPAWNSAEALETVPLTSEGWGPIRVGMTRQQLMTKIGPIPGYNEGGAVESCALSHPDEAPEGLHVMFWDDVVSSVWISDPRVLTAEGLGSGATASQVRETYGDRVSRRDHEYEQTPGEYLDIWTIASPPHDASPQQYQAARGISFHVGEDGKAYLIAGGDGSIRSVEGCA